MEIHTLSLFLQLSFVHIYLVSYLQKSFSMLNPGIVTLKKKKANWVCSFLKPHFIIHLPLSKGRLQGKSLPSTVISPNATIINGIQFSISFKSWKKNLYGEKCWTIQTMAAWRMWTRLQVFVVVYFGLQMRSMIDQRFCMKRSHRNGVEFSRGSFLVCVETRNVSRRNG